MSIHPHYPFTHLPEDPTASGRQPFDSTVEERFSRDFLSCHTGWELRREPEPIVAGSSVFISDFGFEMGGEKVFQGIAGFWTEEYPKRKLACSAFKELKGDGMGVLHHEKKVPVKEVVRYHKEIEEGVVEREQKRLADEGIPLLEHLGYGVKWHSLDPKYVVVTRK